jgi:hypothetical protein
MMQLAALKRNALEQKHLLEHYFTIYDAFQDYVDKLTPYVLGKPPNPEMAIAFERFRLYFSEHEHAFLEWHEGEQVINEGIAAFLNSAHEFENNPEAFRLALTMATTKFEILSKMAARDLRELHEHIAALEGQDKAEKVTGVPVSALKKLADLDTALEIGHKWLGRAVQYAPWVYEIVKRIGGA